MDPLTQFAKVPQELKDHAQWVTWRMIKRGEELAKVPFQITGEPAKSSDPSTWNIFEAVVVHVDETNFAGFVFSADDPFVGIDLDGCRNPETGKVEQWAKDIIVAMDSYCEVSPSGTGVKIWIKGVLPEGCGKKCAVEAASVSGKKPGIEIYDRGRYFAVTGKKLAAMPTTVEERQQQLDDLLVKYWKPVVNPPMPQRARTPVGDSSNDVFERARKYVAKMAPAVSGERGHDRTFAVACVLVLGFELSHADAMSLMHEYNGRCSPAWSDKELLHKVASAFKTPGERGYLKHARQENWRTTPVPDYARIDYGIEEGPIADDPERSTEPEVKPTSIKLTTLADATREYAEKLTSGKEVLITTGIADLDHAVGGGFAFGEMVIMAARPSHGKSAVALQCVHHWTRQGMACVFVSEEMTALSLGKRTVQAMTSLPEARWIENIEAVRGEIDQHFAVRAPCYILESCRTTDAVTRQVEQLVKEHAVQCVVVDYAQLLQAKGTGRYENVTNVSIALKQLALSTNVLLLTLCQLSRGVEGRESFMPKMSDLKESGQLEQDADAIVFNVWPCMVSRDEDPTKYQFFVAKNKNRGIIRPAIECRFDAARQTVQNMAPDWLPDDPFGEPSKSTTAYGIFGSM